MVTGVGGGDASVGAAVRILLVDDEAELRAMVHLALSRQAGMTVVGEAGDGAEAIRMAEALAPDLVVIDLNMPTMRGEQALPVLRRQLPLARFVVLSGDRPDPATRELADLCLAKGGPLTALVDQLVGLMEANRAGLREGRSGSPPPGP